MLRSCTQGFRVASRFTPSINPRSTQSIFEAQSLLPVFNQNRTKKRHPPPVKKPKTLVEDEPTKTARKEAEKVVTKVKRDPVTNRVLYNLNERPALLLNKVNQEELVSLTELHSIDKAMERFWYLNSIGKHPTKDSLIYMFEKCAEKGKLDEILKVKKIMEASSSEISVVAKKNLAAAYLKNNQIEKADEIVKENKEACEKLSPFNSVLCGAYFEYYLRNPDAEKRQKWLDRLITYCVTPVMKLHFLNQLSLEQIQENYDTIVPAIAYEDKNLALEILASRYAIEARDDLIISIINQKKKDGQEISVDLYDSLFQAYAKLNKHEEAFALFDQLASEHNQVSLTSLYDLIQLSAEQSDDKRATQFLYALRQSNATLHSPASILALTKYYVRKKNLDEVKKYWHLCLSHGLISDPSLTDQVVELYIENGEVLDAYHLVHTIKRLHIKPLKETYDKMITALMSDHPDKSKELTGHRFRTYA